MAFLQIFVSQQLLFLFSIRLDTISNVTDCGIGRTDLCLSYVFHHVVIETICHGEIHSKTMLHFWFFHPIFFGIARQSVRAPFRNYFHRAGCSQNSKFNVLSIALISEDICNNGLIHTCQPFITPSLHRSHLNKGCTHPFEM